MQILPLEACAILTEINKELKLNGFSCIVRVNGKVDFELSVFEVLNHINAIFPNCEMSFGYMFTSACNYVAEWAEHFDQIRKNRR